MNIDIDARKRAEAALRESEERYRALFESMDEAYAVVDVLKDEAGAWVDFRFVEVNPAFIAHTGMPWPVGRTATELLGKPNPRWTQLYGQAVDTGQAIRVEEAEPTLNRVFDLNIFTLDRDRNRVAVLFTNITERKRAEVALRESEERNRLMIELVPAMLWSIDPEGRIVIADQEWQRHTGQRADEDHAFGLLDAIHPDDRDAALAAFAHALATGEPLERQQRNRQQEGDYRWHLVRHVPVRGADGAITRWFGAAIDIHELHDLQSRQEILVNELQHRSRNLLGVITAVADRTVKQGGSVEAFEERLQALSRAQGLLSQTGSDTVEVGALARAELAAHADGADDRITISGPTVHLTARQMQNFALALHELTTNAVKYGALKSDTGRLVISWDSVLDRRERRRLALNWVESGVAIEPDKITRRGYGTELIQEALAYALEATVDYALGPDGVRCRIEMPLA
ncbi:MULTISPECIES: PAS domain S-box protein [unclassified Methylobacterium]|jgi:PAS domain S-box-containing protein|uniref:PAS domain S-box protein n=1 Tax=unclassified Methylobacterium TaxID=2615210 RepID=UPI001353F565|nr:PAS domain S-box protein [Methylobacterium sp. 2A]MWV26025.1 PAS domain S-box protein [Methylobacterium sp. 2A]